MPKDDAAVAFPDEQPSPVKSVPIYEKFKNIPSTHADRRNYESAMFDIDLSPGVVSGNRAMHRGESRSSKAERNQAIGWRDSLVSRARTSRSIYSRAISTRLGSSRISQVPGNPELQGSSYVPNRSGNTSFFASLLGRNRPDAVPKTASEMRQHGQRDGLAEAVPNQARESGQDRAAALSGVPVDVDGYARTDCSSDMYERRVPPASMHTKSSTGDGGSPTLAFVAAALLPDSHNIPLPPGAARFSQDDYLRRDNSRQSRETDEATETRPSSVDLAWATSEVQARPPTAYRVPSRKLSLVRNKSGLTVSSRSGESSKSSDPGTTSAAAYLELLASLAKSGEAPPLPSIAEQDVSNSGRLSIYEAQSPALASSNGSTRQNSVHTPSTMASRMGRAM